MKCMKLFFFLMLAANVMFAAEVRILDKQCRYSLKADGSKPTYRELLETLVDIAIKRGESQEVVGDLKRAIASFGSGVPNSSDVPEEFDYTSFYRSKEDFYSKVMSPDFPYPFREVPENQRTDGGNSRYDVYHALVGVLQYNAYEATGGDS